MNGTEVDAVQPRAPLGTRIGAYLAIAFGLSWAAQVGLALAGPGLSSVASAGTTFGVAAALMWPPALAAFAVRRWLEGGRFDDAGLRWGPKRWLAVAWVVPPALTLVTAALSLPVYPFDPSFPALRAALAQAGQAPPLPLELLLAIQVASALTLAIPINCVFTFGEEFGWRGYLLPRLMAWLGPGRGLASHGAVWGLWHAPLILLTGYNYPQHPVLGVPLFAVFCALLGVVFGWLQLRSGSVVPATVAHASLNATAALPAVLLVGVDTAVAGMLISALGCGVLAAFIAWLWFSGELGRALAMAPPAEASSPFASGKATPAG